MNIPPVLPAHLAMPLGRQYSLQITPIAYSAAIAGTPAMSQNALSLPTVSDKMILQRYDVTNRP